MSEHTEKKEEKPKEAPAENAPLAPASPAPAAGGVTEAVHLKLQKRVEVRTSPVRPPCTPLSPRGRRAVSHLCAQTHARPPLQELERTLRDTQQLLELRMLNPSVMVDDGAAVPQLRARPTRIDDSGTMPFPPGAPMHPAYAGGPTPPAGYSPRRRQPGGITAATVNSLGAQTAKYAPSSGEDDGGGPPFRSQMERRQWLLQEKRRWLVEMRLGKTADAISGIASSPKLPPLALSGGANVDTVATPRCV